MRVMIMAAGLGTRLRPLTEHLPKPVAPVGNRPCVDYLLRRIADAGCTGAIMNLHYHPQTIIDTIGDGSAYGMPVEYSIEEELLGTAGGTRKCRAFLTAEDDVFLVTSGDGLHTIDLAALAAAHRASGALATITVKRVEEPHGSSDAMFRVSIAKLRALCDMAEAMHKVGDLQWKDSLGENDDGGGQ